MERILHLQNGKKFASLLLQNNSWIKFQGEWKVFCIFKMERFLHLRFYKTTHGSYQQCVGVSEVCPHEPGVRAAAELVLGPEASVPHPHSAILASADDPPAVVALDKADHLTGVAS